MAQVVSRKLGKDGPKVPAVGFGCMNLSAYYTSSPSPDEERFKVLDRAAEIGSTLWITSDVYGDSEEFLGKWFKRSGKRNEIFLATKFGYEQQTAGAFPILRSDGAFVKEACDRSLAKLGIDRIDLYLAHRIDGKTPIEETVNAMVKLKNEGKISYLGFSEISAATLRRAHAVHPISAIEVEYSPFALDIEHKQNSLLATCRELGVSILAYSPLGRGMLTGRYKSPADLAEDDGRKFLPRFSDENFPKNLKLVNGLGGLAEKKGITPSIFTLAWLLAQGDDIIPIPGTTKTKYLEENFSATKYKLSPTEVAEMRELVDETEVHGARYPEGFVEETYRDSPPWVN